MDVSFAVGVEEFFAALLPSRFEFGGCDVPVRPAFPGNDTQVLAEIFESGPAEEPVAVVDFINDKTVKVRLKNPAEADALMDAAAYEAYIAVLLKEAAQ